MYVLDLHFLTLLLSILCTLLLFSISLMCIHKYCTCEKRIFGYGYGFTTNKMHNEKAHIINATKYRNIQNIIFSSLHSVHLVNVLKFNSVLKMLPFYFLKTISSKQICRFFYKKKKKIIIVWSTTQKMCL